MPHAKNLTLLSAGVVGFGRIGTAVILRAKAFGFALSFYDPGLPAGAEKGHGVARADSFDELVAGSDAITFHCPYSASSKHLLNAGNMPPAGTGLVCPPTAAPSGFRGAQVFSCRA